MVIFASQKAFEHYDRIIARHMYKLSWQQINEVTEIRGQVKHQHQGGDILTIADSSEDEEWGEMYNSGRDVCPSSSLRCFINNIMKSSFK